MAKSRVRFKYIAIAVVLMCGVLLALNVRTIVGTSGIYEGSMGMRGCRWNDSPAQVIKTINQNLVCDYMQGGYAVYESNYVDFGTVKANILFYFDRDSAELKMIDYLIPKDDYEAVKTDFKLRYKTTDNPILEPRGCETWLYSSEYFVHVTIVPRGEDYRTADTVF